MSVTIDDIADMLTATIANQPRGKFTDISSEYNQFIVMPFLFTKAGGLVMKKGGVNIEETLMIEHGGRSRWVGELDEDTYLFLDHLKKLQVKFVLLTDNMIFTRGEMLANRGKERINNVIKPRRHALFLRVAHTMEDAFFAVPDASDELTPWGLKYWLVKNTTAGFNGGLPAGFSTVGNINLTQAPTFKNYTAQYVAVTKPDLITKMKRAHRKVQWKMPHKMSGIDGDTSNNKRFYLVNEDVLELLEDIGEGQNENLGKDVSSVTGGRGMGIKMDGEGDVLFKKRPIVWAQQLDDDTSDPVYGVDLNTFHAIGRQGENMRLDSFKQVPGQHRVVAAHLDHQMQFINTNRRANFVISK